MIRKTVFILLGLMLGSASPKVGAEGPVVLQSIERKQDLASTTLTLRFSELPEYEIRSGGQRVDLDLLGGVVAGDIGTLPEDERIIKILLAGHREGLLVSFLFRSPPARVSLKKNVAKKELEIDCFWSEPHGARPGMAMYIKGMPVPREDGTAVVAGLPSMFGNDWNTLYSYHTPLRLRLPVSVHVPELMPLPEGPWYSGMEDALAAAREGRWEAAASSLETISAGVEPSVGFLALSASALLHGGEYSRAALEAERLAVRGRNGVSGVYGAYVNALALAGNGDFPEAGMILRSRPDVVPRGGVLVPYWRLLLAELAIQHERPEKARILLEGDLERWPESLRRTVQVRRADLLAESGKGDEALRAYAVAGILDSFPSSMWRKAELLFDRGEYGPSAALYARVRDLVRDDAARGLVQWREGLALVNAGRVGDGEFKLKMVVQDYYETEAFDRARLTLLDMRHRGQLSARKELPGLSYAGIARHSKIRALRQEAMLKQAFALHGDGHDRESVVILERFLHEFINGRLRSEGQVLLADILPGVVESLIDAGESLQALVLVERNRDLLINSRMRPGFLERLADGFAGLALYSRAARVLQYLLDAGDASVREGVYVPLGQLFVRLGQPDRLERLVREYESGYPKGGERAVLRGMWAEVLLDAGDVTSAVQALPPEVALGNTELEKLLVRIQWKAGDMSIVASCLKGVELAENMHAYRQELLLRGEALLALERYDEALPLFEVLARDSEVAGRAGFRLAEVLLALGRKERGRALLEGLTQNSDAGRWAVLAGETLEDLDLGAPIER